jgi:hypothetical protein
LDLIADQTYIDSAYNVNATSIAAAFDCNCEDVISVYADYDGSAAAIYGQLDIRNA